MLANYKASDIMFNEQGIQQDSSSWIFFVKACFFIAVGSLVAGIVFMPVDWWIKGYLAMGNAVGLVSDQTYQNFRDVQPWQVTQRFFCKFPRSGFRLL